MKPAEETGLRRVGIFIFDAVEVLDFAGPFEVFAVTAELNRGRHFDVAVIAAGRQPVMAANGLEVIPGRTLADGWIPDVLVLPGGSGTKRVIRDRGLLGSLAGACERAEVILSVCSGARILAKLGLLDGLEATTHHEVIAQLSELAPAARLVPGRRFVDAGRIVTTGGISAGIDGALHLVGRLAGEDAARRTARYMEYDSRGFADGDEFTMTRRKSPDAKQ